MSILFFLIVIFSLFYSVKWKPGAALAYILFFQTFNKIVFDEVGLGLIRYSTTFIVISAIILIYFRRKRFEANLKNLLSNRISNGYAILFIYMVLYSIYVGTSYESIYIIRFLMPGIVLFLFASLLFFDIKMYKDMFIGIIFYTILTYFSLNLFMDFSALTEIYRGDISEYLSIGPLTQGRMAGVLTLFGILYGLTEKSKRRYIVIPLILFGLYWLFLTGTRGAILSLIITLLFFVFFSKETGKMVFRFVMIGIVILTSFILIDISTTPLVQRGSELIQEGGIESTTRFYRILLFIDLVPDHFIFGLGPGGWGKYVMIGDYRYPHNLIIEAIIEFGIVGMIFLIMVFGMAFYTIRAVVKSDYLPYYLKAISLSWVFYAMATMTSGSLLTNAEFHTISGVLVGLGYYVKAEEKINSLSE